ncbi:MAG: sulfite exporter TauE/SafE family protein [Sphingobacteriales bacterium]|jgi:sulfite exporter TauE/SafE
MWIAFILGLVSSLHCVGMCGPLAMMVPGSKPVAGKHNLRSIGLPFLYNLGRASTYALFGLLFGLVGRGFAWFGWQQKISVALGIIILISVLVPGLIKHTHPINQAVQQIMNRVRTGMSRLLFQGKPGSVYVFGLLNGLLPCGMVYMALAGAIATGDALKGAGFMFVFGLGTLPAMWSVSIFSGLIRQELRIKARKIYPAVMAVIGILLILRGLNLDIPYISPALHISHSTAIQCHD